MTDKIQVKQDAVASLERALERARNRNSPNVPTIKDQLAKANRALKQALKESKG